MTTLLLVVAFYYHLLSNKDNWTPENIKDYAVVESKIAGVDEQKVLYTIEHESHGKYWAVNKNDMAVGCDSVGPVQIRDCNHPEVSFEQAQNPVYAVNFLIKNIDKCKTWWKNSCGNYVPYGDT